MQHFRMLTCALMCALGPAAVAGSFDDAVTLYLQGFEHCSSAKALLSHNKLDRALKEFAQYEAIKSRAAAVDKGILASAERGMDSNIKYCNRVGTDIELAQGTPLLERSLALCDEAFDALKQGNAEAAQQWHQQYVTERDKALSTAPSLNTVFSLKNEMRRCDRLQSKIANIGKQQAGLASLLESAREESEAFNATCGAAHKEFEAAPLSAESIQIAEKALAKSTQYKRNAEEAHTQVGSDPQVVSQLNNGNQCLAVFSNALAAQKGELSRLTVALQKHLKQLESASQQCDGIAALAAAGPQAARYEQGKSRYEAARKSRDDIRRALAANSQYQANPDGAANRQVSRLMDRLNGCLETARTQVAALMPPPEVAQAVTRMAVAPALQPAVENARATVAKVPAIKLTATLQMSGLTPEFVLVYWMDGTRARGDRDAELFPTGFGKKLYVLQADRNLQLRNADFASHVIALVNPLLGIEQKLVAIGSRQSLGVQLDLPVHTLAVLRSNQERVAGSFVVNGLSTSQVMLEFNDNNPLTIELDNPKAARQIVVLMPDTDPLVLDVMGGDDKKAPLTRNKVTVGTFSVLGL